MDPSSTSTDTSSLHDLLRGKIAVVVGASRGIGAATSRAFAAAGAKVVLAARDERSLEVLAASIREAGGDALVVPTDVLDARQIAALIDATLARYNRLDVAFNNAGEGNKPIPLADMSVEDIDASLALNLRGVLLSMRLELAAMQRAGGGSIVNMSSTAGLQGAQGLAVYSAAKHGIIGATKSAALEYASRNIRVNVVAPGPILNERMASAPEQWRAAAARAVPLGRVGQAEEVAAAVTWLASDQAAFITGAVLSIDGGRLAGSMTA
jgi:NAD(P)-dependent dehydrogenase (short-subunit alcohol dehydrogenase family)